LVINFGNKLEIEILEIIYAYNIGFIFNINISWEKFDNFLLNPKISKKNIGFQTIVNGFNVSTSELQSIEVGMKA
jgi:hypothetical protein